MEVSVFEVPTDQPEADGTLAWDKTTVIVVEVYAQGERGTGWTYSGPGAATVARTELAQHVIGHNVFDIAGANQSMLRSCRNMGGPGLASCAISAVDIALWDLKARLLSVPLVSLFGRARDAVPVYGSGGFTTYDDDTTVRQLEKWVGEWGMDKVKIKIGESWGTNDARDLARVALARRVIGDKAQLFVDANGAYTRKQAVRMGRSFHAEQGVTWFEEPVSSDDLPGLREVRDSCAVDVAAGEYGFSYWYFAPMVAAQAVDCVQADVTRCGGYTGWLAVAALCAANQLDISGHCAPNLHAPVAACAPNLRHLEYFHDHHRIENMLFDGALSPDGGALTPRTDQPGHGLTLAERAGQYTK
jgi:L-alanine-DL-glutamate epimerase-like enolase superfamily enzyme